jgi:hypothetical protein
MRPLPVLIATLFGASLALAILTPARPASSAAVHPFGVPSGYATLPPGSTPMPQTTNVPAAPAPATSESPATPTTLDSSTPASQASALPSPSGSAVPRPLRLDHAKLGIVLGATTSVGVGGGTGPLAVRASFDGVVARYDAKGRRLRLTGRTAGAGTVTISDSFGDEASIQILVGPAAGIVPSDVTIELGGTVSPQFASAKVRSAIVAAAQLQPGTTLELHGFTLAQTLHPGDVLETIARVHVNGTDTFVEANGTTNVHVKVDTLDTLVPTLLYYSDDPEKLQEEDDGVLYRATLDPAKPARIYLYHVSMTPNRRLFLALQSTGAARVQVLGYAAGPSGAYGYAGHVSTLNYLLERATQESAIVPVASDAPAILPLGYRAFAPLDLIDAIFDLRALEGGPVDVSVVAASNGDDPIDMLGGPERPGDGHGRRGEFALDAVAPIALALAAGAPDPAPFTIGIPGLPNLRAGGRPLAGDYGVVRALRLDLSNPTADPQTLYFYELPQGGALTTTLWFDGDDRPTEIPCVRNANRYTIRSFTLAPSETRTITGSYMTDGASSFPLLLGLSATPASPPPGPYSPDACAPKPLPTTAPTATPSDAPTLSPSLGTTLSTSAPSVAPTAT